MQHIITFHLKHPLTLPIAYQHAVQSMIYNCLRSAPVFSEYLHNHGYQISNGQTFKHFCFSLLQGRYKISNGTITFTDQMTLEIRTSLNEIDSALNNVFSHFEPLLLVNQTLSDYSYTQKNTVIQTNQILIKMISPICIYNTIYNEEIGHTIYLNPTNYQFYDLVTANAQKKYYSLYKELPSEPLIMESYKVSERDKFVTKFKNKIYITAWNGFFKLKGSPDLLTFLYNEGIGSRNSQGFGMFKIIN